MHMIKQHRYSDEEVQFILERWENNTDQQIADMFNEKFKCEITRGAVHIFLYRRGLKRNPYVYASNYTEEMCNWIRENYNNYANAEAVTNAFNERFGVTVSKSALWHKAYRLLGCEKVRKSKEKIIQNKWSKEMEEWLKVNLDNYSYVNLAKEINKRFGANLSASGVEHKVQRLGIKKDNKFSVYNGKQNWFNKGTISWNKKPIGYERVDKHSDIIWIKVDNPDVFMPKHRVLYMQYHNLTEIPEGVNIVFKNGDKRDFREENLIPMTNADMQLFNTTKIQCDGDDEVAMIKMDVYNIKKIIKEIKENGSKR